MFAWGSSQLILLFIVGIIGQSYVRENKQENVLEIGNDLVLFALDLQTFGIVNITSLPLSEGPSFMYYNADGMLSPNMWYDNNKNCYL
jgi:hypothetical protein